MNHRKPVKVIKQVIPAPQGWYAIYGRTDNGAEIIESVGAVCAFVYLIEDGEDAMVGVDGETEIMSVHGAEEAANFLRYVYSPDVRPEESPEA